MSSVTPKPGPMACENCAFFSERFLPATCRKAAPDARVGWPKVDPADWCGEFFRVLVDGETGLPLQSGT